MKVLVVGLGALGSVYACLLKAQGHQVTALVKAGVEDVIREQGVSVTGIWGDHSRKVDEVVADVAELEDKDFDVILLTVKSFDTDRVVQQIKELILPKTLLILLQNGYGNFETAAKYVDKSNLVLGRVIFGSETLGVGKSKVTVIADDVILGSPGNFIEESMLEQLAKTFSQAGIPTRASADVMKYVWGKIIYNSALNPLGAIFEVNYGKLAENEYSKALLDQVISEIFDLLKASGQETLWPNAEAYKQDFYTKMVPTTAAHHASMLQDILRGRKTEIDALNGALVQLGREYGVAMPANATITTMIKAKEQLVLLK